MDSTFQSPSAASPRRPRPAALRGRQVSSSSSIGRPPLRPYQTSSYTNNAKQRTDDWEDVEDEIVLERARLSLGARSHSAMAELFPHHLETTPRPASKPIAIHKSPSIDREPAPTFIRRTTYSSLPPSPDNTAFLPSSLHPSLVLRRRPSEQPVAAVSVSLSSGDIKVAGSIHPEDLEIVLHSLENGGSRSGSFTDGEERARFRARSLPPETVLAMEVQKERESSEGFTNEGLASEVDEVEDYHDVEEAGDDFQDTEEIWDPPRSGRSESHHRVVHTQDGERQSSTRSSPMRTPTRNSDGSPSFRRQDHRRESTGDTSTTLNEATSFVDDEAKGSVSLSSSILVEDPPPSSRLGAPQARSGRWTLWEMLLEDGEDEMEDGFRIDGKWDRITNFLAVPLAIEKISVLGSMFCLDSMLYLFTILPIRVGFAWFTMWKDLLWHRRLRLLPRSQIQVIIKMLLLVIPTVVLLFITDTSKMYHSVRGQDNIKLYVIFNVLEIGDRLCGAIGQDIMDTLFAKETLDPGPWRRASTGDESRGPRRRRQRARPIFFFFLALAYVHVHAIVFLYQLVCLNVAINSYDNALLTLLVSNQFVEIKGSVFKKFEKENLFQITCADIVERFQLGLMLSVIAVRNMVEMAGSDFAFLPKSFIRGKSLIDTIWSPVLVVIFSEMVVDWVKHGFITKFNHIRASCYERFADVLCKDIIVAGGFGNPSKYSATGRRHASFADQSPLVNRRLGFASIPLACLVVRVGVQGLAVVFKSLGSDQDQVFTSIASATQSPAQIDALAFGLKVLKWSGFGLVVLIGWFCMVAIKIVLGIQLLRHASRRVSDMDRREVDDRVNDFGRSPVGDSQREKIYSKAVTEYLSRPGDDLARYPSMIKVPTQGLPTPKVAKPKWRLEEVERWTMIKRIF